MDDCVFCRLYKDNKIFDKTKNFFVNIDKYPTTVGHVEIIPKRHVQYFHDLSVEEAREFMFYLKGVLDLIKNTDWKETYTQLLEKPIDDDSKKFLEDAINSPFIDKEFKAHNIGINQGEIAGQTIPHLHIHIFPRYSGDVEDHIGGVRHMFPEKGNYKKKY